MRQKCSITCTFARWVNSLSPLAIVKKAKEVWQGGGQTTEDPINSSSPILMIGLRLVWQLSSNRGHTPY